MSLLLALPRCINCALFKTLTSVSCCRRPLRCRSSATRQVLPCAATRAAADVSSDTAPCLAASALGVAAATAAADVAAVGISVSEPLGLQPVLLVRFAAAGKGHRVTVAVRRCCVSQGGIIRRLSRPCAPSWPLRADACARQKATSSRNSRNRSRSKTLQLRLLAFLCACRALSPHAMHLLTPDAIRAAAPAYFSSSRSSNNSC